MRTVPFVAFVSALVVGVGCDSEIIIIDRGKRGPEDVCSPFDDATESTPVTFRIRNETGVDLYLSALCAAPALTIESSDSSSIYPLQAAGHCLQTCEELRGEAWSECGDDSTAIECQQWSFLIAAGSTRDVVWPGTTVVTQTMPDACWRTPRYSGYCNQLVPMPPGTLKLWKDPYPACEGDCTCDANGICRGGPSGFSGAFDVVEFQYPDDDGIVDVVFDSCTFGCAGG